MDPKNKPEHGASSETSTTVVLQENPVKRIRNALSSVQVNDEKDLDNQWLLLQSQSTYRQLLATIGITSNSVAWSGLNFSIGGKDVGPDPAVFHKESKLARHPSATKDDSFASEDGFADFDYDALCQKLSSAASRISGPTWPVLLVGLAAYLPETVVDAALRENIKVLVMRKEKNTKVDTTSKLLLWMKIGEEASKDDYDSNTLNGYFKDWLATLKSLYVNLTKKWKEFEEAESPRENNPVLLIGRWASLRFRRLPLTTVFGEERRLVARLASLGTKVNSSDGSLKIPFSLRRRNLALIIRSCKSVAGNVGVNELAMKIEKEATSDTSCMDLVQRFVSANGTSTIDEYFGLERFDYTKKEKPRSSNVSTPVTNSNGKTHRQDDDKDAVIPRPKYQKTGHHHRSFKYGKSFYDQAQSPQSRSTKPNVDSTTPPSKSSKEPTLSQKLGVPSDILQERRQAGLCLKCGATSHRIAQCPKNGGGKKGPTDNKSRVGPSEHNSESSVYGISLASTVGVNERVLIVLANVSPVDNSGISLPLRVGLDTYSTHNMMQVDASDRLHLKRKQLDAPAYITVANGQVLETTEFVQARLSYAGYCPILNFLLVREIPQTDIIVGFSQLNDIGVRVVLPPQIKGNKGGLDACLDDQVRAAEEYLTSQIGVWKKCPGGEDYKYRLRRLLPGEVKDTPEQSLVVEIDVAIKDGISETNNNVYDYSVGLYNSLSDEARTEYQKIIKEFTTKQWWSTKQLNSDQGVLSPLEIVTFPLCQKSASTKIRACSDARLFNGRVETASYSGWAIDDIVKFARAGWNSDNSTLTVLDLSRAFYKVRLAHKKHVLIKSIGKKFLCDRVIFGVRYGPCGLASQVLVLCNAVLSAMLGREVEATCTSRLIDVVPGLMIIPYYDDFFVIGTKKLVDTFENILCRIAPSLGVEIPEKKKTHLARGSKAFHLGLWWKLSLENELSLECPLIDCEKTVVPLKVCKRLIFSVCGQFYDPLYCHATSRLVADLLRAWSGKATGGWDVKYDISADTMSAVQKMVSDAVADFSGCSHLAIPMNHHYLLGFCDACEVGGGCCIISSPSESGRPGDPDTVLLEAHSSTFNEKEEKWHVNRKEFLWLLKTLRFLLSWLQKFGKSGTRLRGVSLFCDNTTATSWSTSSLNRRYDIQAVHRMHDEAKELLFYSKKEYNLDISVKYLPGVLNSAADNLSRKGAQYPKLDGLQKTPSLMKGKAPTKKNKEALSCIAFTDSLICTYTSAPQASRRYQPDINIESYNGISMVATSVIENEENGDRKIEYESLTNVSEVSTDDILEHCRKALSDAVFTKNHKLYGICLEKVVEALHRGQPYEEDIQRLCFGGAKSGNRFKLEEGLLFYRDLQRKTPWLAYLPTKRSRAWALYKYHINVQTGVHRGTPRTIQSTQKNGFWWPSMVKDLTKWIKGCQQCQLGKTYEPYNPQPLVFRRGMGRFNTIQVDFTGSMEAYYKPADVHCPGELHHLLVMVDEGTRAMLVLPTHSTSALDLIMGLLVWFQVYNIPSFIQLDQAGAHVSDELTIFAKNWNIELLYGVARRPQTQGLVEGAIRSVKETVTANLATPVSSPWYISGLLSGLIHNQSNLVGSGYSPHALTMGLDIEGDILPSGVAKTIEDRYIQYRQQRDERAANAEIREILSRSPRFLFHVGDKVRLVRRINQKRVIQGPFVIQAIHPVNRYLYKLYGKQNYVSIEQLLPFREDTFMSELDYSVNPQVFHCPDVFCFSAVV